MYGRYDTRKNPKSSTFSRQWSGVSYAPHCDNGCRCPIDGEQLHLEGDSHYCPACDDFRPKQRTCTNG